MRDCGGVLTLFHFNVGNVAAGPYTITVTGNTGDKGQAAFIVTGPSITLTPNTGPAGTTPTLAGTGFWVN